MKKKYNIFVVDDENHICSTVQSILSMSGHNVETFPGYRKVYQHILSDETLPDIVITDYKLSEYTGVDLLQIVKNIYPEISFIIITGYGDKDVVLESLKYGAEDFLDKPFKPEDLRDVVQKIILKKEKQYYIQKKNASEIVHELSHYLQDMRSSAYKLQKNNDDALKVNIISDKIEKQIDNISNAVNTMIVPEKFLKRKIYLKKTKSNLKAIIESLLEILKFFAEEKDIVFSSELVDLEISCDYYKIIQVIRNILINAIIYSPKKSRVIVKLSKENNNAVIIVADEGSGISDEHKKQIFDYGTRVNNNVQGSGIGLFFAKNIVTLHQGNIVVSDNNPTGSIFKILLPL